MSARTGSSNKVHWHSTDYWFIEKTSQANRARSFICHAQPASLIAPACPLTLKREGLPAVLIHARHVTMTIMRSATCCYCLYFIVLPVPRNILSQGVIRIGSTQQCLNTARPTHCQQFCPHRHSKRFLERLSMTGQCIAKQTTLIG